MIEFPLSSEATNGSERPPKPQHQTGWTVGGWRGGTLLLPVYSGGNYQTLLLGTNQTHEKKSCFVHRSSPIVPGSNRNVRPASATLSLI